MKLLIRNLARTTTEAELRAMFEAYGTVQSCTVVMDKATGKSKGFGFIEMPSPGEAKVAAKSLDGVDVAGNKIRVKKAEPAPGKGSSGDKDNNTGSDSENKPQKQDPLHGVTLEVIVTHLVEHYGWEELGKTIKIKCFTYEPSIKSSLKFLRETSWARKKVEALYLRTQWPTRESPARATATKTSSTKAQSTKAQSTKTSSTKVSPWPSSRPSKKD